MRTMNTLWWVVLILSLPAALLFWLLDLMGSGLRSTGIGSGPSIDLARWAVFFTAAFVVALLLKVGLAVKTAHARHAAVRKLPKAAQPGRPPGYAWTCYVCDAPNPAAQAACVTCGSPADMTSAEIKAARARLARHGPSAVDSPDQTLNAGPITSSRRRPRSTGVMPER